MEAELAADEVVLGCLRRCERHARIAEPGAGVGHRGSQHQPVEVVADVVVVPDDLCVASGGVASASGVHLFGGRRGGPAESPQVPGCDRRARQRPQPGPQVRRRGPQRQNGVEEVSVDVDVAGDEGPAHAELPRRPQQLPQRFDRPDTDDRVRIGRPPARAVPELEPGRRPAHEHLEERADHARGAVVNGDPAGRRAGVADVSAHRTGPSSSRPRRGRCCGSAGPTGPGCPPRSRR